tara:strand:+ start:888 stop:1478 length:591 start_codon:yes stop_codon:yes gene_type:complete
MLSACLVGKPLKNLQLKNFNQLNEKNILGFFVTPTTSITNLNLSDCVNVGDSAVKIIASRCPFLKSLSLRHCVKLTGVGLDHCQVLGSLERLNVAMTRLKGADLLRLVEILNSNEKALALAHIEFGGSGLSWTNELLLRLGVLLPRLKTLEINCGDMLGGSKKLTDEGLGNWEMLEVSERSKRALRKTSIRATTKH